MVKHRHNQGFTLIELSIVLVVIGLIVGGILVGQNLINAAAMRAQISQIEKYNTAANTFREKFGFLPGDITPQAVTQFNFTASPTRTGAPGSGDGNGELDGNTSGTLAYSWAQTGENLFFWEDLSTNSHLIEGAFNAASGANGIIWISGSGCSSIAACSAYLPYARIGNGAFVYVYSGYANRCPPPNSGCGPNFFGLSIITSMNIYGDVDGGSIPSAPALTVAQAYAIDSKIDDGLPTTGNVLAQYLGTGGYTNSGAPGWSTNGSTPSASTCYDTSSGIAAYSISYQNGALMNCGISFRMQAGD
jgi:prepilin-type N-terminal cleavage/methylation domain-containing protein